jgi:phosphate transport system substrate-binding protein
MLEWIRDNEPGINVNYQSIGSGGGIAQFLEETVDFGSTERYLTDEEVEDAREIRGCDAIHIPDAFGGGGAGLQRPGPRSGARGGRPGLARPRR